MWPHVDGRWWYEYLATTGSLKKREKMTELTLLNAHGIPTPLSSLWQESIVAFYFLRHIG